MKIRVLDNEDNRKNRFTKRIIGEELEVDEIQGNLVRCKGIFLYSNEFEVMEETVDLSKENKELKKYKARKIDRETGKVIAEGTMNSKGEYNWNE